MSAPMTTTTLPRQVTPGEQFAILLTGACVLGEKASLQQAAGMEMEPYEGSETMTAVINVCLGMAEQWGYIADAGATEAAWDFVLWERLEEVPDGHDCAEYCRQYYQDWRQDNPMSKEQEVGA